MKYGLLFLSLAAVLVGVPLVHGSWTWFTVWPAVSTFAIGLA